MRALLLLPLAGWWLVLAAAAVAAAAASNETGAAEAECQPKACQRDGDSERPACGTDGLTYPNRCHLERARCRDPRLRPEKRGACRRQRPCPEWAALAGANATAGAELAALGAESASSEAGSASSEAEQRFVAACRPDGTYDAAQCHPATGYCWCVTPDGVPLPYTAVRWRRDKKPRCGRKKKNKRRSPTRKHKARICKQSDKAVLNSNLINSFQSEYIRAAGHNDSDSAVVRWKFAQLDGDGDGALDRAETRELRRVARKAVRPRRCARDFPAACDVDGDQRLALAEWEDCLSRDGMTDGERPGEAPAPTTSAEDDDDDDDDVSSSVGAFSPVKKASPERVLIGGGAITVGHNYDNGESSDVREEDPTDCSSDRKAALADKTNQLYVPECTPDGRYQKVQCIQSAGYCFCVHEDTGKTVAGTTVKGQQPKCDAAAPPPRPMRGCPDARRAAFTKELLRLLRKRMADNVPGAGTTTFDSLPWIESKDEQAATWSFVVFDTNKNKVLERNEWKAFKEMVAAVKGLRKCGKKLPRYCDSNRDRQITMTEWRDCLNVQQVLSPSSNSSSPSPRAGKINPLSLLKDD